MTFFLQSETNSASYRNMYTNHAPVLEILTLQIFLEAVYNLGYF